MRARREEVPGETERLNDAAQPAFGGDVTAGESTMGPTACCLRDSLSEVRRGVVLGRALRGSKAMQRLGP